MQTNCLAKWKLTLFVSVHLLWTHFVHSTELNITLFPQIQHGSTLLQYLSPFDLLTINFVFARFSFSLFFSKAYFDLLNFTFYPSIVSLIKTRLSAFKNFFHPFFMCNFRHYIDRNRKKQRFTSGLNLMYTNPHPKFLSKSPSQLLLWFLSFCISKSQLLPTFLVNFHFWDFFGNKTFYSRMPLLMPTTVISCEPSLCLKKHFLQGNRITVTQAGSRITVTPVSRYYILAKGDLEVVVIKGNLVLQSNKFTSQPDAV